MKQYRILIVDDEPFTVDWIADLLERDVRADVEYDLCRAYSADEALHWFARARIDLLITDIRMPGLSGLDLARSVRQSWPDCKVVILTAFAQFDYAYEAISLGVVGYILKNEEDAQILRRIRGIVDTLDDTAPAAEPLRNWLARSQALEQLLGGAECTDALLTQMELRRDDRCLLLSMDGTAPASFWGGVHHAVALLTNHAFEAHREGGRDWLLVCTGIENAPLRLMGLLERVQQTSEAQVRCLIGPEVAPERLYDCALRRAELTERESASESIMRYALQDGDAQLSQRTIQKIQEFVAANITGDVSLTRLSEITGYNPSYLSRFYKANTGERLSGYIARMRMNHVRRLIQETTMSLDEIYVSAGFSSRTYFNRFVRQYADTSPQKLLLSLRKE